MYADQICLCRHGLCTLCLGCHQIQETDFPSSSRTACAGFLAGKRNRSVIDFEQHIEPKHIPAALTGLARRIAASTIKETMEDFDREARLIERGCSTFPELNRFASSQSAPLARIPRLHSKPTRPLPTRQRQRQAVDTLVAPPSASKSAKHALMHAEDESSAEVWLAGLLGVATFPSVCDAQRGLWCASLGNLIRV
jgi:hypothetical protein